MGAHRPSQDSLGPRKRWVPTFHDVVSVPRLLSSVTSKVNKCHTTLSVLLRLTDHLMRSLALTGKISGLVAAHPIASSLAPVSVLSRQAHRTTRPCISQLHHKYSPRDFATSTTLRMSQKPFSNTEVPSDKPADPYTATNKSEPDLKEKVNDLVTFIESCKFGMMTTRIESSGLLTSRCMALAAKVRSSSSSLQHLLSFVYCIC